MSTIKKTFNGKGEMDFVVVMMLLTIVSIGGSIFH